MAVVFAPYQGLNAPLDEAAYLAASAQGRFGPGRTELLDGVVNHKLSQGRLHMAALFLALEALRRTLSEELVVYNQATLRLSSFDLPEPDLVVLAYDPNTAVVPPTGDGARLVVEVSDTTLRLDRTVKARLYAGAGIAEYWIVNPVARQVEVRRLPVGGEYTEVGLAGEEDTVAPLYAPDRAIAVADLLPAPEPTA